MTMTCDQLTEMLRPLLQQTLQARGGATQPGRLSQRRICLLLATLTLPAWPCVGNRHTSKTNEHQQSENQPQ